MDSLIRTAARTLEAGDPLGALNWVALRGDAPALALRGIALARLGDLVRATVPGQEGALIVQEVKSRSGKEDYDVATGEYVDLVKAGVVDPTKVTRYALQNTASISALMLTTEALVTEMSEKEKPASGSMDY